MQQLLYDVGMQCQLTASSKCSYGTPLSAAQATSVTALNRFWHGVHVHHRKFSRRPCLWPSVWRQSSAAEAAKPLLATPQVLRWTNSCRRAIGSVRLYSVLSAVEKHAVASPNRNNQWRSLQRSPVVQITHQLE